MTSDNLKVAIASVLASSSALTLLERVDRHKPNLLRVLAYHRVDEPNRRAERLAPWLISATPAHFARQMQYLARHYRVLSAQEVVGKLNAGQEIPSRAVLITFDDGYRDFAEQAWPIMRRLNLPVTVFIATAYPDDPSRIFWWDRLYQGLRHARRTSISINGVGELPLTDQGEWIIAFKQVRKHLLSQNDQVTDLVDQLVATLCVTARRGDALLNWDEIRQLAAEGVTFAAHTRTHPFLSRLTPSQVHEEVSGALADLALELAPPLPILCYPDGHPDTFSDDVMDVLRQLGIVAAFTMIRGINQIGKVSPLALRRLGVSLSGSMSTFRFSLTSARDRLRGE